MNDLEFAGRVLYCVTNGWEGAPDLLLQCQQRVDAARRAAHEVAHKELKIAAGAAGENPDPPISELRPKPPSAPPLGCAIAETELFAQYARLIYLVDGLQVRVCDLESERNRRETYEAEPREREGGHNIMNEPPKSEAKHTPGPWRWGVWKFHEGAGLKDDGYEFHPAGEENASLGDELVLSAARYGERCTTARSAGPETVLRLTSTEGVAIICVDEADKALIAAAPDLLAACDAIATDYVERFNGTVDTLLMDDVRAAVAKAKGECADSGS